ncbi:MAG: nucleotidyltransferase [Methanospirillum sp.]|nr:nucleotidyltransferase [Methanospirillum sp.]
MADAAEEQALSRARILARLRAHRQTLAEEFSVAELALFGSVARGEPEAGSDIDLMVVLSRPLGWDIVLLRDYLESLLGAPVDLVVRGGMERRPALWDRVSRELVYV